MRKIKGFPVTGIIGAALLGATFAGSTAFSDLPSRQTPMVVSKDRQGLVEVGPCQMPPAVGARVCTPNARDYGYFEGTWRKWPTQQRYDQTFPQAIGATPITPYASRPAKDVPMAPEAPAVPKPAPPAPPSYGLPAIQAPASVPAPAPGTSAPAPEDVDASIWQEINPLSEPPAAPATSEVAPTDPVAPAAPLIPAAPAPIETPVQPEIPAAPAAPSVEPEASPAPMETPTIPAVEPAVPVEEAPLPMIDTPNVKKAPNKQVPNPLGKEVPSVPGVPVEEKEEEISNLPDLEDVKETSEAPGDDFSQNIPAAPTYDAVPTFDATQAYPEYNAQLATMTVQPAEAVSVPATWEEKEVSLSSPSVEQVTYAAPTGAPASTPAFNGVNIPSVETNLGVTPAQTLGLAGFCPVTLLSTEQWVEGDCRWSVLHHGVTYHLASPEMVQLFLAAPDQYTPVLDGNDPVSRKDKNATVAGNTDYCVVYEGKLYMFSSEETMNQFFANTETYRQ